MSDTLLTTDDNLHSAIFKLSKGNPGAMMALIKLTQQAPAIDGDNILGAFGPLLTLDLKGLEGAEIWMLYKDVCREDVERMLAIIRSFQLGLVDWPTVKHAINNRGAGLDTDDVLAKVKERLPKWNSPVAEELVVA